MSDKFISGIFETLLKPAEIEESGDADSYLIFLRHIFCLTKNKKCQ